MASNAITILIEAQDQASKTIAGVAQSVHAAGGRVTEANKSAAASTDAVSSSSDRLGRSWLSMSAIGGAVAGVVYGGLTNAFHALENAIGAAVERTDTLNNFPKIMTNFGVSAADATVMVHQLDMGVRGLPTSLNSIVSLAEGFVPLTKNTEDATKTALALNNAVIAGGAPMQLQTAALEQFRQALSKGVPDLQDWKSIEMAMPAQLKQIAEQLGIGSGKLKDYKQNGLGVYQAMKDGYLTMDDFNAALIKLNQQGINGLPNFATQAKNASTGIATSFANMRNAINRGIADILNGIGSDAISKGAAAIGKAFEDAGKQIAEAAKYVKAHWSDIQPLLSSVGNSVGIVANAIFTKLLPAIMNLVESPFARWLGSMVTVALNGAAQALAFLIRGISSFISEASRSTSVLMGLAAGFVAYKAIVISVTAATKLQEAAQTALNRAMKLNPYALVAAAAIGIVTAYIDVVNQTNRSTTATQRLNDARRQEAQAADNARDAEHRLRDAQYNAESAALQVKEAQKNYNDVVAQFGPKSLEAQRAALELKRANYDLKDANDAAAKATRDNSSAQNELVRAKQAVVDANAAIATSAYGARDGFQAMANAAREATKQAQAGNTAKANQTIINSLKIPIAGGHALGTNFAPGGLTWVGERGPELVQMPTGSKVYNAKESAQMAGGGTTIQINGNISIASPEAAQAFWDRIDKTHRLSRLGMGAA